MVLMTSLNQYLVCRNGHWHYNRRIPSAYADIDPRTYSKASLKTTSLEIARARRDAMVEADELYWTSLLDTPNTAVNPALRLYRAAKKRALARGFVYLPAQELADRASLQEILERLNLVANAGKTRKTEAEAMLGGIPTAAPPLSEAFEIYCTEIAATENLGKSQEQKKVWKKTKLRAITNFCAVIGDLEMDQITRKHAQKFRSWWGERLKTNNGQKGLNPGSANRDIGNLRKLYSSFWIYEGEPDRPNPFDQMRFTGAKFKEIPPFSDEFVRQKILRPGVFDGLNNEATLIIFALIETGCRPSEIVNLVEENILLEHDVPHIRIRNRDGRQVKSDASVREIPLVGVSLEAMRRAPAGFPRYRDNSALLSASLLKAFRNRNLLPTKDHRIYSFRHSLEKRMLEAELDYGFRCLMMGHKDNRPKYGDGGSMTYRRDQLLKIVHPYPEGLFE